MIGAATQSVYSTFIRISFLKMLAYRLRYYTGILTYLIHVAVYYFIWKAIYSNVSAVNGVLNGFTFEEMVTYVAVGWIARSFYFSDIDYDINELVRSGEISNFLIRPVNFQIMMLSQAFGASLFRLGFFSIPIGVVVFITFPVMFPQNLETFALFALSTLLGFGVFAAFNFLIGLLAFALKSIEGVMRAKANLIQLLSGLLLPLSFFPDWFRILLEYLPFKGIAYVPLQIYMGKISDSEACLQIALQGAWLVALLFAGTFFWSRAMNTLAVQGG